MPPARASKRSLVAVSTGLLERMSRPEVEAVLGHEVAHIKNGDMVTMALLQGVVNAFVMFIARIIAWVVTSSIKSERGGRFLYMIVVFACEIVLGSSVDDHCLVLPSPRVPRRRAGSAELVGSQNMAAALRRLLTTQQAIDTGTPAMAAYKISDKKAWLGLLSTHPPLEERIAALEMRVG